MRENNDPKSILDWLGYTSAPRWKNARAFGYVFGAIFLLLFLMSLSAAFVVVGSVIRGALSNDVTAGAQLSAGALIVALLGAPFLIWRTMIAHQTLGFQKEGHITDRISKAVEQLGAVKTIKHHKKKSGSDEYSTFEETIPNIEVRIGGIASLERIAQDSVLYDAGRDHVRIMEILSAYIRDNTKRTSNPSVNSNYIEESLELIRTTNSDSTYQNFLNLLGGVHQQTGEKVRGTVEKDTSEYACKVSEDVILALRVIGRRNETQKAIEKNWHWKNSLFSNSVKLSEQDVSKLPNYCIDLSGANLQGCFFHNLDFSYIVFEDVDLDFCVFENVELRGAKIIKSKINYCTFKNTIFDDSEVLFTSAIKSTFYYSTFERATLQNFLAPGSKFLFSDFSNAKITKFDSPLSHMQSIKYDGAKLSAVQFEFSTAWQCSFFSAVLLNVNFSSTQFRDADFSFAKLIGSTFTDADIGMAKMAETEIYRSKFNNAKNISQWEINATASSRSVVIPEHIVRPNHWID